MPNARAPYKAVITAAVNVLTVPIGRRSRRSMPGNPLCARETRGINHPSDHFLKYGTPFIDVRSSVARALRTIVLPHIYDAFMFAIASMNLL
jgi:hypothetical protein